MTTKRSTNGDIGQDKRDDFSQGIADEETLSESGIKKPYDPSKIQVDNSTMTVFQVMRKISNEVDPILRTGQGLY